MTALQWWCACYLTNSPVLIFWRFFSTDQCGFILYQEHHWIKKALQIRKDASGTVNPDEGAFMLSRTWNAILNISTRQASTTSRDHSEEDCREWACWKKPLKDNVGLVFVKYTNHQLEKCLTKWSKLMVPSDQMRQERPLQLISV